MQLTIKLSDNDNKKLANLCGPLDENITQIATGFEISIKRRGSSFSFNGQEEDIKLASQFIESLYLRTSKSISAEDIQLGLVEVNKIAFKKNESPELHTKKNDLQGRTPKQVTYLKNIQSNDINFGIGPAGTGKTYLAVASAVDALNREKVKRIVLVRPAVEAGERLGFLPGDLAQKVDPYLRPLYDALYDLAGYDNVTKLFEKGILEVAPLAYGTKAVVTGDITQIDLAKGQKSGLIEIQKILKNIKGIEFTKFKSEDVVRHPLVQKIVNAYEKFDE